MRDRLSTSTLARGRWLRILVALGVPPKAVSGHHGPCIFCGGKDRARFTDFQDDGWYYCNQCGKYNGFRFLMKLYGWSFKEAADQVDRVLGTKSMVSMSRDTYEQIRADDEWEHRVTRSTRAAVQWLAKNRPERLEGYLDSRHPEVRMWWETQR